VQNRYGTLHGGCVATLVDVVSTVALLTVSKDPGVRYVHFF
jgi:acyl-coenzyme A thioesterase 13